MSITTSETKRMLEAQPWIDIRLLASDDKILIEAPPFMYELKILTPVVGILEISSSDNHIINPTLCAYVSGVFDLDDIIDFPFRLAATLKMKLQFRNGVYISQPMVSARLTGKGYFYDVF